MTKEEIQYEAQSIIQEWDSNDSAPYVEFVEKLASMELPESFSDLDKAADTFNREDAARMWDYEGKTDDEIVEAAFKSGAGWMAEQGVSMQIMDDTKWEEVDSFIHKNVEGGSIIQIRKK